jgi:hypothetical protein
MQKMEKQYLELAIRYGDYVAILDRLLAEGKTTGNDQSEKMVNYASLNQQRMKRISKTYTPSEEAMSAASKLDRPIIWLVITEGWCGDAAQNIPILDKLQAIFPKVELKLILRDENPELMDQFLTNGGRSIPKLIALDANSYEVIETWGPRPAGLQKMVMDFKRNPHIPYEEFTKDVQLWYAKDKGRSTEQEIIKLMQNSQ